MRRRKKPLANLARDIIFEFGCVWASKNVWPLEEFVALSSWTIIFSKGLYFWVNLGPLIFFGYFLIFQFIPSKETGGRMGRGQQAEIQKKIIPKFRQNCNRTGPVSSSLWGWSMTGLTSLPGVFFLILCGAWEQPCGALCVDNSR